MKPILITEAANGYVITYDGEVSIHISLGNLLADLSNLIQSEQRAAWGRRRMAESLTDTNNW